MAPKDEGSTGKKRNIARRAADRRLLADHELLSAILDTAGALIVVLDTEGRVVAFNRACEELTGFSAEEAKGRCLWDVANPPEEADTVQAFYHELLKSEFPEAHERHWCDREGVRHLIRWNNTAIYSDDGSLCYIVATGFDITESRQAKLELEERGAQLTERVKELRCLYGISRLSERNDLSVEEFIQGVVELIPHAWQYSAACSASVKVDDLEFSTAGFADHPFRQETPVMIGGREIGRVVVCYSKVPPGREENPFLQEEASLLENIGEAVSRAVAVQQARRRIQQYQQRLRSLASELALTGERERRRIAQELHNEIGHKLASIKFKLSDGSNGVQRDQALLSLVESTIESSRNLTFQLSPPVLHELGLGAAMEWLAHQLEANYGIPCEFEDDRAPKPLTEDLRVELFQAVRELLANIGKHSGASAAAVSAWVADRTLQIKVTDNGSGFDLEEQRRSSIENLGWGLFGIHERLGHLGAEVRIDTAPNRGTTVTLAAPLSDPDTGFKPKGTHALEPAPEQGDRPKIRILLVDDQRLTRAGLRAVLEKEPDLTVVAEAADGEEAVTLAAELNPDVVVMDVAMPKLSGIEATAAIRKANPEIKVIGLSMHADGQYILEMLRVGATGYLLKDCAQEDLAQSIRVVQANLTFLSPGLADNVASKYIKGSRPEAAAADPVNDPVLASLTRREVEVLKLLAEGLNTKQIAAELSVSIKTVESHRQHVMEKAGTNSVADLTRLAIRLGLVDLDN